MALHKILIFVRYDEQEFECYLDAYIDAAAKVVEAYRIDEVRQFLDKIKSYLVEFDENDDIDLYLVQTDQRSLWNYAGDFEAAGMHLADQTCWTDADAYKVLEKMLNYQPGKIVLIGKDGVIGSQVDGCICVYSIYCARPDGSDTEMSIKEKKKTEQSDEEDTEPTLASLMRQLAEGRNS